MIFKFDTATNASVPVSMSPHTVVDLTITQRTGTVKPYAAIRNLGNVAYDEVFGYPAEGRSFEVWRALRVVK